MSPEESVARTGIEPVWKFGNIRAQWAVCLFSVLQNKGNSSEIISERFYYFGLISLVSFSLGSGGFVCFCLIPYRRHSLKFTTLPPVVNHMPGKLFSSLTMTRENQ